MFTSIAAMHISLSNVPRTQAEISCLVLQFVAEDLTQFEERTGDWRRSFLAALLTSVDTVFPFLVKVRARAVD